MRQLILLALPVLLFASNAQADEKIDCKSSNLNQMQLNQCAGIDFDKADAKLNALYRDLIKRYDPPDQALLKAAENKWIAYRDAECAFETNLTIGGTIHPMVETFCWTEKTNARMKELTAQMNCGDGDTECNPPSR